MSWVMKERGLRMKKVHLFSRTPSFIKRCWWIISRDCSLTRYITRLSMLAVDWILLTSVLESSLWAATTGGWLWTRGKAIDFWQFATHRGQRSATSATLTERWHPSWYREQTDFCTERTGRETEGERTTAWWTNSSSKPAVSWGTDEKRAKVFHSHTHTLCTHVHMDT